MPAKHLLLLFLSWTGYFLLDAQTSRVNAEFLITSISKEPVPLATITLTSATDSTDRMTRTSDSSGRAGFQLIEGGFYRVQVSLVNYKPVERNIRVGAGQRVYSLLMEPLSRSLERVVVTATKPLMRQEDDKTIVDPESLASMSTNAYEILEKTPGIFLDNDGNVYLSSTTPATVYINGREQKMSAADIATMLKNLPPNAIASIEILRTPSARYDASGSGGIINIVLKKGIRIGLTGSLVSGMNQGKYGNQFIGFNLNNNDGRRSSYINLQYGRRETLDSILTDRFFAPDSVLSQNAGTRYSGSSSYVGYGFGYQLTNKWEINYDGRFGYNTTSNHTHNLSEIKNLSSGSVLLSTLSLIRNRGKHYNLHQGVNLKYKIDSTGSEWSTDISYTMAPNSTVQVFHSGDGDLDNRLGFLSVQTNFLKKMGSKLTFEAGVKTTRVHFKNNTDYFKLINGNRVEDHRRTGAYRYHETINSAYLQGSRNFSGVILKVGTRMENTNMNGHQLVPADTSFSIHRTDFFPYIYLSRTVMNIAGYDLRAYLVFRRTINRPAYEYLNPSLRIIDPFLYETGNPSLRPQFTKNYEANISVDERPLVAIGLNDTKDIFTQVIYPVDSNSKISSRTYDNLGNNKETYIRLLGAIPPGKRYFFVVGAQYNHNFYSGFYENKPLSFKKGSWIAYTYHQFKLTPLTQFSMNGFLRLNGQQQFYELSTFGEMRISINQQFLKKKLNVTLSVVDVLKSNRNEFTIHQGSIHASGLRQGDTRRAGVNIRYNFGLRKKEESNNMFNIEAPSSN